MPGPEQSTVLPRRVSWSHHQQANKKSKWLPIAVRVVAVAAGIVYLFFVGTYTAREGNQQLYNDQSSIRWSVQGLRAEGPVTRRAQQKPRVAYAISVTADGPYMDGAAVLAHSIRKASETSQYGIDLIALVFPNVTTSRKALERSGWRLIEKDLPLRIADIKGDYLRERIEKNGCCGATELLKLYSWSFTEYHRVVHLDMDSLMLGPMDELFEVDKDLIYTCDYGMMTKGSAACPVQGGFIVVKPSLAVFGELVDTVLEGDYRDGGAWGGTHIGWFWGGMTIQGLLPYFFLSVKDPQNAQEVDRCVYNNMFDNPECRNISVPLVKNVHFTVCQKPWTCFRHDKNVRCNIFLDKWHELRKELEEKETGTFDVSCDKHFKYHPMAYLQDDPPPPEGVAYSRR